MFIMLSVDNFAAITLRRNLNFSSEVLNSLPNSFFKSAKSRKPPVPSEETCPNWS